MSIKKIIISFLLLISFVYGQSGIEPHEIERAGQSGWQFLKINGDARQAAMGSALTAIGKGDANSVFGNPAALAQVNNMDVVFNRANWIADIGYNSISIAKNFNSIGFFALHLANVDYGSIPETINSVIVGEDRTEAIVTGRTYTASDIAIGLSYARRITEQLSVGGSVRWIRETIAEVSMDNWAVDIGTLFYTGFRSLRLGLAARNFGPDSHFFGFSEEYQSEPVDVKMPLDFRFGIAMDFLDTQDSPHILTLALEATHPNDESEKLHFGTEYTFNNILSIRGGYKFNYDEESFTFGFGINYPISDYEIKVHYAYVDFGDLKNVHMFTLGLGLE